jgi:hypothetical protein
LREVLFQKRGQASREGAKDAKGRGHAGAEPGGFKFMFKFKFMFMFMYTLARGWGATDTAFLG